MIRTVLAAGAAVVIAGAGAAFAQTPAPQAPAAATPQGAAPQAGAPGRMGMGAPSGRMEMRRGMRQGARQGMRGGGRTPPTAEQLEARNTQLFAELDANRDGRATFEEFRQLQEQRRDERQRQAFQRFSNGQDSVTLSDLNARAAERMQQRQNRRGNGEGGR
jgi:hypothetical protein